MKSMRSFFSVPASLILVVAGWLAAARAMAQSDIPADYAAIIGITAGTSSEGYGTPGSVPVHGRASFPILIDPQGAPALSAGRYGHGVDPNAARAVAASHTGFFNTSGTTTTSTLFTNAVQWASRKTTPSTIRIGSNNSTIRSFFAARGYLTKTITTSMSNSSSDLSNCDVFIGNMHDGYSSSAISKIQTFAANGGGVVIACTPWALSETARNQTQAILAPFGLSVSGSYTDVSSFTVAAASHPTIHSALIGLDAMLADAQGTTTMSLANKRIAAAAVDRVLAVRPNEADMVVSLDQLSASKGWIQVTQAAPLVKNNLPVEAMLARYQSSRFDQMAPGSLFVHPSAADWPGLPEAGTTVSRTFAIQGNVPADSYINWGDRGRRYETRLYAAPGATITVQVPADKINAGLTMQIGCHIDENFHLSQWNRFPKVTRSVPLNQTQVQTGSVFGGLIWIQVPAGANLGNFQVTVSGALEAPCFQLGVDTDEDWNQRLKHLPGAWGCIMTPNVAGYGNTPGMTVYVSRRHLQNVASAVKVAEHWKRAIETADDLMGYSAFRKRGESALCDRDIVAGYGHAGFPVMMAYGDSDVLVNGVLKNGDWGFYHELGHTYQDSFDGAYGIATHGEVDVNLVPALLNMAVHDKTCWDGDIHSTFNGSNRLSKRNAFMARAAADQTWSYACSDGATAYDFYFNLAEAFGWDAYRTALSRLMAWLQGGTDAGLSALSTSDPNYARNRFYLLFCDATGRNLDSYFQRYGLGVTGRGYEISASVKTTVANKGYPVWIDNSPVDGIGDPGTLEVSEATPIGSAVATLQAIDPEEPGTMWTWSILGGNAQGRWSIDRRTGVLRVAGSGLDREVSGSYALTIQAQDGGVGRTSATRVVNISVVNELEPPKRGESFTFVASNSMSAGTVLGQAVVVDQTRTMAGAQILAGNVSNAFAINASGQLVLQTPSALAGTSVRVLSLRVVDSAGEVGQFAVRVLVNAGAGVREQRWSGATAYNNQNWTGSTNYTGNLSSATSGQNVANNYSRRLLGWLIPQVSGTYKFWIASDDQSRLYLGTDAQESSKALMASVDGYTGFQNFDVSSSQESGEVELVAGRAYWFEVQHYEGSGSDHVAVAWQGGGVTERAVIAGTYLIPNQSGVSVAHLLPSPPAFSSSSLVRGPAAEDTPFSASLAGEVADADPADSISYSKISGPAWLAVSPNGTLSGTPGQQDVGTQTAVVRATDSSAFYSEAEVTIVVEPTPDAPVFASSTITGPNATEDQEYQYSIAAQVSDPDPDETLTFQKMSGASWLAVSPGGLITGLPGNAEVGTHQIVVRVTDSSGLWAQAQFQVTVVNVNDPPSFVSSVIMGNGATQGEAYAATLAGQAVDPDAGDSLAFSKVSGPGWLSVAPGGALSGTPGSGDVGLQVFLVRVADAAGLSATAELRITVADVNDAPVFGAATKSGAAAKEDEAYSGTLAGWATDVDEGDVITYSKRSGPDWLQIAANGLLSGTPLSADVGTSTFVVRATDAEGLWAEATLTIEVQASNDAPVFTVQPILAVSAVADQPYTGVTLAGLAVDPDPEDTIVYSKVAGPEWLTVAADGTLSGTPPESAIGLNVFTVRATDSEQAYGEAELRIEVSGQQLPLPWQQMSIGGGAPVGTAAYQDGEYSVTGAGAIGGREDAFQFVYQTLSEGGRITARITQMGDHGGQTRAGVMFRESLASNARNVFLGVSGDGLFRWSRRTSTGSFTSLSGSGSGVLPDVWVRLTREGDRVTAEKSANGVQWVTLGSLSASFSPQCYFGLAVASGETGVPLQAKFEQVIIEP